MRYLIPLLAAFTLSAANNDWSKVIAIPSGDHVRILRTGAKQPITAVMDEANADRIVVVIKNTQQAIPKSEIERLDSRPAKSSRVTRETKVSKGSYQKDAARPSPDLRAKVPSDTTSGTVTITSAPDFQLVYQRKP